MITPRWRKVVQDLWRNKSRTLLVILTIAVGVVSVGMIAEGYVRLSQALDESYASSHAASAVLVTTGFSSKLLEEVRQVEGVRAAEGRRVLNGRIYAGGDGQSFQDERWKALHLAAVPDFHSLQMNRFFPVEGAWPPPQGELLLEQTAL